MIILVILFLLNYFHFNEITFSQYFLYIDNRINPFIMFLYNNNNLAIIYLSLFLSIMSHCLPPALPSPTLQQLLLVLSYKQTSTRTFLSLNRFLLHIIPGLPNTLMVVRLFASWFVSAVPIPPGNLTIVISLLFLRIVLEDNFTCHIIRSK